MRQIGIFFQGMGGLSDEDFAKKASEVGFDCTFTGVSSIIERHIELADLFAKYGMIYETLHAPFSHINDIWLDCEGGDKMYEELIHTVNCCVAANVKIAVVHLSSGLTPPPITDLGRVRFTKVIEYAAKKGVILAFENQRRLDNLSWVLETFSAADSVGFCWDCGHESCFTPGREYMPLFGNRIVCTHIHDNSGRFDEDDHVIPFDGQINFERFTEHINKWNYTGSLMLEVEGKHKIYSNTSTEEFIERAAIAANRLRQMVDGK